MLGDQDFEEAGSVERISKKLMGDWLAILVQKKQENVVYSV